MLKHVHRSLTAGLGAVVLAATASTTTATAAPSWTVTPTKSRPAVLNDVAGGTWAVGADLIDGFADQRPLALRWDGKAWKATPQPVRRNASLESVAVAGPNNVWAVGTDNADPQKPKPLVMRWNGSAWRVVPGPAVPTGAFGEVQVGPDGAVWAAGWAEVKGSEHAVVYRYLNGAWQQLTTGLEQAFNGNVLAVVGKNEAWLGLNAGLARFDGKSWKLVNALPTNGSEIPTGLVASSRNNVWLVGVRHGGGPADERPLAMHYDGTTWKRVTTPNVNGQLYDVALHQGRPVAVGERFTISGDIITAKPLVLQSQGTGLVEASSPAKAEGTLTGVSGDGGRLWTVGLLASSSSYRAFAAYAR